MIRKVKVINPESTFFGQEGDLVRFESGLVIAKFNGVGNIHFDLNEVDIYDVIISDSPTKPDHYHKGGIDVFTYASANFNAHEMNAYHRITALKYITRAGKKAGNPFEQDIKKAIVHLEECLKGAEG